MGVKDITSSTNTGTEIADNNGTTDDTSFDLRGSWTVATVYAFINAICRAGRTGKELTLSDRTVQALVGDSILDMLGHVDAVRTRAESDHSSAQKEYNEARDAAIELDPTNTRPVFEHGTPGHRAYGKLNVANRVRNAANLGTVNPFTTWVHNFRLSQGLPGVKIVEEEASRKQKIANNFFC